MELKTSLDFQSSPITYAESSIKIETTEKVSAIHRFQKLMQEFINLVQENRREISRLSDENKQDYALKTDKIKGLMDSKGWTGLEIGIAAAGLATLATFIPHMGAASDDIKELFDSLGGVDTVKKLFETGSQFAEGAKPVFNTWDDAQLTPEHTGKEFLENNWKQAQEAVRQNKELIPSLLHIVEKVRDEWSETRYD